MPGWAWVLVIDVPVYVVLVIWAGVALGVIKNPRRKR